MKVIEQEIAALKNTINEMWALVHQQIYNAGEATRNWPTKCSAVNAA